MVTVHKMNNREYCETAEFQFSGLSTDTKPTEWHGFPVGENSLFFEEDTGDFYYYDGENWNKIGSGGSSPSGDGHEITNPVLTMTIVNNSEVEV